MRQAATAWQHVGMAWRTAGGGTGFTAARTGEGAAPSGTPIRRLLAGNLCGSLQVAPKLDGNMLLFLTILFCMERRRTDGAPA